MIIAQLKKRLQGYQVPDLPEDFFLHPEEQRPRDQAAVLIPIETVQEPQVVLTLRSADLSSHGGEVAWPGGRHDLEDETLLTTALRETREEIGLHPEKVEIIGELRPFISRHGLLVIPFVGLIESSETLQANPDEIDAIFRVPLAWLQNDPRSDTNEIARLGEIHRIPEYHYEGHRIWGLTAMILKELLVHGLGVRMD
ncbi:MAG: CoA pyrophosphatase [Gammaproteobacteria bacterium]|nr:CoA pyrophosphatase [Gammaproteobacteria bacterium]